MNAAATALGPHLFWISSRAAGIAALVLSSASVAVGVTMGGRLLKGRGPDLRVTHEALSLATMAALVVHAATLLGDGFLKLGVADVSVPFASTYKTGWTSIGIVGGWLTILLGLSYYLRTRIGTERWRLLHRWTLLAWALAVAHSLGEGTDAGQAWFLVATGLVTIPAAALAVSRLAGAFGRSPSRAVAR